jgi:hypothetical protein
MKITEKPLLRSCSLGAASSGSDRQNFQKISSSNFKQLTAQQLQRIKSNFKEPTANIQRKEC